MRAMQVTMPLERESRTASPMRLIKEAVKEMPYRQESSNWTNPGEPPAAKGSPTIGMTESATSKGVKPGCSSSLTTFLPKAPATIKRRAMVAQKQAKHTSEDSPKREKIVVWKKAC